MSVRTPAEIHVGVRERAARMCVPVSSRGQAGSAEGEGVSASEVVRGGPLPAAVSLPWVPALGSPGGSLGFQALPRLLLGEESQLGQEAAEGTCPDSA